MTARPPAVMFPEGNRLQSTAIGMARLEVAPPRRGEGFQPAERPRAGCPRSDRGPARRALRLSGACQTLRRRGNLNAAGNGTGNP